VKNNTHKSSKAYTINNDYTHQDNKTYALEDVAVCAYDISDYYEEKINQGGCSSAIILLSVGQKLVIIAILLLISYFFFINSQLTNLFLVIIFNLICCISYSFKYIIFQKTRKLNLTPTSTHEVLCTDDLPIYSVIVPAYKEALILPKLLINLYALNYPKDKLQILLILESDDLETIAAATALKKDYNFDIIIVPDSFPKTKPKACNHALNFAKGKYIVLYDADDKPCSNQLLQAVEIFKNSKSDLVCIQARLNYYNAKENFLTQMFAIEYAIIFNYILPALEKLDLFIPLGGTSNHFKANIVKFIKWDQYNLTEDADIGVRLKKGGYKVKNMTSYTMEEAPITLKSWIKQRSRWSKGFIQTYFTHIRELKLLYDGLGLLGVLSFHIFFIFGLIAAIGLILGPILIYYLDNLLISICSAVNLFLFFCSSIICAKQTSFDNKWNWMKMKYLLFPFYLILQVIPTVRSLIQLSTNLHYWEKTKHGASTKCGAFDMNEDS